MSVFLRRRPFSTSTLSHFDWTHGPSVWRYPYTDIKPEQLPQKNVSLVFFPSCSLLSTKEEWRESAELLSNVGYKCILIDWPGWHTRNTPINWAIEEDSKCGRLVSTMTDFAYATLQHIKSTASVKEEMHVVVAGGSSAVHIKRALLEMSSPDTSLTCFAPSWRFYLTRFVSEGYPRKLSRRRSIADWFLDRLFVRSRMMFKMYRSKVSLAKLTRRLYENKLQHNSALLDQKRNIIMRDRPLSIDAAMISGYCDPITSTSEFIDELIGAASSVHEEGNDDSDDDDGLLNIKAPTWVMSTPDEKSVSSDVQEHTKNLIPIHLVFPQDVVTADRKEMDTVRIWADHAQSSNVSISEIAGKLFSHEEHPALAASIIQDYVSRFPHI